MKVDTSLVTMGLYDKKPNINKENLQKLKSSCDKFESEILKFYLKDALKEKSKLFPESPGEKIYKSMEIEKYSDAISGHFGYSELLFNYLQDKVK